jgi:hypothetical protein
MKHVEWSLISTTETKLQPDQNLTLTPFPPPSFSMPQKRVIKGAVVVVCHNGREVVLLA